ncbi:Serine/threonine-protein kinase ppk1 [Cladobotryum mycophilum]|uniref:Serine/threonine-protein kinase ppk1 n=1 Tax=Cladobotryum mycophilum TaxID=491253 RepID=A0ABR0SKK5_9HYPO
MSSAALQTAPHQPTALPSNGTRQYAPTHTSPNREIYNAHQSASGTSPSSRRPPSRKTSGAAQVPFDPNSSVVSRTAAGTTRPSEHISPGSDRLSNAAPVAPPRTSSTHLPPTQRRTQYSSEKMNNSPRHGQSDSSRTASRGDANGATNEGRSRRAQSQSQHSPQDTGAYTPSRDAHPAETSLPVRQHPAANSKPPREASESLNRAISNGEDAHGHDGRTNYHTSNSQDADPAAPPPVVPTSASGDERRTRSRHDHSRSHKSTTKFGDFILGNTIGEGEFGKVKLGWKQDSSVQVAIKLIKRDSVGTNPSRLAKIKREVTILRGIHHPNIVRLIDMVETDRYIGIILEYASGGELFDYILNHRYLKDNSARRLFSQLISGVGYLHKKGIVHRDLKLENLLLDRNRNIIITDFGFANTFDPHEELNEEEELNLSDRDYVKRIGLDKIKPNGTRKGDLMQTSCGSPCYAAPELVVSDSLYTGRKVDVWSCGVILYAMLAGYLPFDDDPANPEGDNINLLYKYIVTTPLTFPEYVTPHARDLLRRILVPNPRKRADLFEVARHSWLSEYAHVVEFITSSTTSPSEVHSVSATTSDFADGPMVTRSASVRETPKQKSPAPNAVGGLAKAHGKIDAPVESTQRTSKDNKRRTVQVEYVAPVTRTQRGTDEDVSRPQTQPAPRYRQDSHDGHSYEKPLPREPPSKRPPSSHNNGAPPPRQSREMRANSDNAYGLNPNVSVVRPHTGNSSQSATSLGLHSRGNYGQPAPPAIADTNAQGRIQQPSLNDEDAMGRPSMSGFHEGKGSEGRGHKRSSTIGEISSKLLGRSGSVFSRKGKKTEQQQAEKSKKYPPISMANSMAPGEEPRPRQSIESKASRRSFSIGLGKKRSGSMTGGSQDSIEKKERRRFSLLPASFSLKAVGLGKDQESAPPSEVESQQDLPIQNPRTDHPRSFTAHGDARGSTPFFDDLYDGTQPQDTARSTPVYHQRYKSAPIDTGRRPNAVPAYMQQGSHVNSGSETSVDMRRPSTGPLGGTHPYGYTEHDAYDSQGGLPNRANRGVLQKQHKKFTDAYDQDQYHHEGSSGAAKRVMDFFRRRGKARGGDER